MPARSVRICAFTASIARACAHWQASRTDHAYLSYKCIKASRVPFKNTVYRCYVEIGSKRSHCLHYDTAGIILCFGCYGFERANSGRTAPASAIASAEIGAAHFPDFLSEQKGIHRNRSRMGKSCFISQLQIV